MTPAVNHAVRVTVSGPREPAGMTNTDILHHLRQEWRYYAHTPRARVAYIAFRDRHPELPLAHITSSAELIAALEPRGGLRVIERAQVVSALLHDGHDRDIHRVLLQTLLPGVVSVCRSLNFGRGVVQESGEFMTEAITTLSELLTEWAGQHRPYAAPDILSALRGRLRRWLIKEKALREFTNIDPQHPASEGDHLESRLAAFAHSEHADLARAVYDRVIAGLSLAEIAAHRGADPRRLRRELEEFVAQHIL
jgi:hypothetical protein